MDDARQAMQKERQEVKKKLREMEAKNHGQEVVAQKLRAEKQTLEQTLKQTRGQVAGHDALVRSCKEMAKQVEASRAALGEAKQEKATRQLFQSHLLSLRGFFPRVAAIQEDVLRDVQALRARGLGEEPRLCNIAGAASLSLSMLRGAADTLGSLGLEPPRDASPQSAQPAQPAQPAQSPLPPAPDITGMAGMAGMGMSKREKREGSDRYPPSKRWCVC